MTGTPIRLGISTCPNDTFAFHAILNHEIDLQGIDFQFKLLDIQQLNDGLFAGKFDVAKGSYHAALLLADSYCVLPSGSALGFGVGPLLLSATADAVPQPGHHQETLCPGGLTTATLLFKLFYPHCTRLRQVLFSEIMPALQRNESDFGVCIHEGRFTWEAAGLSLIEDLGERWEQTTGCPLPLGGLFADKRLEPSTLSRIQSVIRKSIDYALENPDAALPTMRKYAQEFDDRVLMEHVRLYVNSWTRELGNEGRRAIEELSRRAASAGIIAAEKRLQISCVT